MFVVCGVVDVGNSQFTFNYRGFRSSSHATLASMVSNRGFGLQLGGNMVVTQNPVSSQTQLGSSNSKVTAAYLDNLVKAAKKPNPNLDGIKYIQSLNIDPEIKRKYLDGELQ